MELEEVKNYAISKETTPLAKYIAGKLVELGSEHIKYIVIIVSVNNITRIN